MIKSKNNSEHYIWGSNCDSWVLKTSANLSVKQEVMPSGTSEKLHFHENAEQFFYILKGEAVFYCNEEKFSLKTGESISILPKSNIIFLMNQEKIWSFWLFQTLRLITTE
jgi:mannose-6-phosphate isomerase-like protein (cupin superfamily)